MKAIVLPWLAALVLGMLVALPVAIWLPQVLPFPVGMLWGAGCVFGARFLIYWLTGY